MDFPYLQPLPDTPGHDPEAETFCGSADKAILAQVLNSYDLETTDFYRWRVEYDRQELSELVSRRSGIDVGDIMSLEPIEMGPSGRIYKLRITGSNTSLVVGKELEIRRILSETHLKSSAFDVCYMTDDGKPSDGVADWKRIAFIGSGWGHGVGLCQIGAAVMASKGYDYAEILRHYYPGSTLTDR